MHSQSAAKIKAYVHLVRAAEALHTEVSRNLLNEGLTASQFSTLKALRFHGPLAQRDISRHILKSGGNITMVVDNLERAGLVARKRHQEDRRLVCVSLTTEGQELFDRIYPDHLKSIERAMRGLDDDQCGSLQELLANVYEQEVVVQGAPKAQPTVAGE